MSRQSWQSWNHLYCGFRLAKVKLLLLISLSDIILQHMIRSFMSDVTRYLERVNENKHAASGLRKIGNQRHAHKILSANCRAAKRRIIARARKSCRVVSFRSRLKESLTESFIGIISGTRLPRLGTYPVVIYFP